MKIKCHSLTTTYKCQPVFDQVMEKFTYEGQFPTHISWAVSRLRIISHTQTHDQNYFFDRKCP